MFCTHCGKKNPAQANFCFNCGTTLPVAAPSTERVLTVSAASASVGAPAGEIAGSHDTEPTHGKQCPSCGLWSPGGAQRCDCGYDFVRGVVLSSAVSNESTVETKGIGWCLEPWKKYASFTGRARRKEYWSFFLFNWLVVVGISLIGSAAGQDYSAIVLIYYIAALLPSIAVGVRRMHDSDHSGAWLLFPIVNLVFAVTDGNPRGNRFGPDPKGRGRGEGVAGSATDKAGAALAVFAVIVAVVGIIAAIAVPGLLRARMSGNEASAIGALRAINSAQAAYASDCGRGGFAQSLDDLAKPPAGSAQPFVAADLSSNNIVKSGYVVTVTADREAFPVTASGSTCNGAAADSVSAYFAEAHPVTIGTTGQRSFATDSRGVIYSSDSGTPIPMGMSGGRPLQ